MCHVFTCVVQLRDIKARYGPELEFMRQEFDRLERELSPGAERQFLKMLVTYFFLLILFFFSTILFFACTFK